MAEAKARKTLGAVEYVEACGFAPGLLPTRKDVVQNMLYLLQPKRAGQAQRSKEGAAQLLAEHLQEHWLLCNLHTIATKSIKKIILKMYEEFTKLYQTRKQRQNQAFSERAGRFNESSENSEDEDTRTWKGKLSSAHDLKAQARQMIRGYVAHKPLRPQSWL
uniref:Uncharacterized protein n=1 Tax=Nothoprocta perdicaria TaxID=30464 RepID=A0A8C7A0X7_NOTPE